MKKLLGMVVLLGAAVVAQSSAFAETAKRCTPESGDIVFSGIKMGNYQATTYASPGAAISTEYLSFERFVQNTSQNVCRITMRGDVWAWAVDGKGTGGSYASAKFQNLGKSFLIAPGSNRVRIYAKSTESNLKYDKSRVSSYACAYKDYVCSND